MPEDHFGEDVAAKFDEQYAYQSHAAVLEPIVAFLADAPSPWPPEVGQRVREALPYRPR